MQFYIFIYDHFPPRPNSWLNVAVRFGWAGWGWFGCCFGGWTTGGWTTGGGVLFGWFQIYAKLSFGGDVTVPVPDAGCLFIAGGVWLFEGIWVWGWFVGATLVPNILNRLIFPELEEVVEVCDGLLFIVPCPCPCPCPCPWGGGWGFCLGGWGWVWPEGGWVGPWPPVGGFVGGFFF